MKNFWSFILSVVLLCACSSDRDRLPSGWEKTDNALADTLTMRLEHEYGHNAGAGADRWIASLDSLARAYPDDPRIGARVAYWRVRMNLRKGDNDKARQILDSASAALDSAKYADDFHHLKMLRWRFDGSLLHRYLDAMEMLDYFRRSGDSTSLAYTLMNLGDIMQRVGDYGRGREYAAEASRIWRNIGQEEYADKNLLNLALMADRHTADSIHRHLLSVPKYRRDTAFYEIVLRNHFLNTDSVDYLLKAMRLSAADKARMKGMRSAHLALYSDWLSRNGRGPEALPYALLADSLRVKGEDPQFDMLTAHALAMAYDARHLPDSAEKYLKEYVILKDTISNANMALEVANKASRDEIARADMELSLKAEREKMMVWILLLVLAIVFILVTFTFYRRARDREMKATLARAELDNTKARLSREALIMKEKEDLLKSIQKEIESSEAEGVLGQVTSTRLRTALKVHNSGEEERRAFLEVHDNMLPGFSERLKTAYPSLSEKQLRLAAYICAGMSSAAIGRVLNITPASVMKSRYRLRSKFRLSSGESLEEFLRSFADK